MLLPKGFKPVENDKLDIIVRLLRGQFNEAGRGSY